ncbi:MAG: ferredoxin [Oryzihumus sp.]
MRVVIDRERCQGAGMCALTAPAVFDQSEEDGRVVVLDADPAPRARGGRDAGGPTVPQRGDQPGWRVGDWGRAGMTRRRSPR